MNHKFILIIASRLIAIAAIVEILISYSLWVPQREFPTLPLIIFSNAPINIEFFLPLLLLFILTVHASGIFLQASAISAVLLFLLAILLDTTRVQPWVYQYVLMFTVFIFAIKNGVDNQQKQAVVCFQIIIASIYIWSGLHKFNLFFPLAMVPWLFQPVIANNSQFFPLLIIFGFFMPAIEVFLGIGLLTKSYRRISIVGLCLMHLGILYVLGPFGRSWNKVVWPWNILMIAMNILLFWRAEEKLKDLSKLKNKQFSFLIILFLASIAPAFNFINLYPSYLSWSLYSSDTYQAQISLPKKQLFKLPEIIQQVAVSSEKEEESLIDIVKWSEAATGVPIPPEVSNYIAAGKYLCKLIPDDTSLRLVIYERPARLSLERTSFTYSCEDIYNY